MKNAQKNKFLYLILGLVILIAIGLFIFLRNQDSQQNSSQTGNEPQETITLTSSGFSPNSLTVKKGTRVIWVNNSDQTATVNSDDHPTHLKFSIMNPGEFEPGSTLQVVIDTPGTYTYHNHLAPEQTGTIVVE